MKRLIPLLPPTEKGCKHIWMISSRLGGWLKCVKCTKRRRVIRRGK